MFFKSHSLKFTIFFLFFRKQRDRLINNGLQSQNLSTTSETGGSDYEDEGCNAIELCLACLPSSKSQCCKTRPTSNRAIQKRLWAHAFIMFVFAVALASLAYYTMTLQNQLSVMRINLDPGRPLFCQFIDFITFQPWDFSNSTWYELHASNVLVNRLLSKELS